MAPLACEARHVVFNEYQVTLFDFFTLLKLAARFGNVTDILVTHDNWIGNRWLRIEFDVCTTDACYLHL